MVRQYVLKFGDDWTTISCTCPYPSMLNLVSLYVVFNMVGLEDNWQNLTLRGMGNYKKYQSNHHQILTQVTGPFVYITFKIVERSSENCWNTSQKQVSYTKLLRSNTRDESM